MKIKWLGCLCFLVLSCITQAGIISNQTTDLEWVVDDLTSELLGANNILVAGSLYDLEFVEGSARDIYFDGAHWDFGPVNSSNAYDFFTAIGQQIFVSTPV